MAKKIKDSEGFIVSWNKDRSDKKCSDKITFFYRYKKIIKPIPAKPWDIGYHLFKAIKKIEKEEGKKETKNNNSIKNEK